MGSINAKTKQAAVQVLKLLLALGIISWLVFSGAFDWSLFRKILSPWPWVFGVVLIFFGIATNTFRWKLLLSYRGIHTDYLGLLKISLVGVFYNFVAPGGIGGDVVKGYYFYKHNENSKMDVTMSILFDRGSGMLAMIIMAAVSSVSVVYFGDSIQSKELVVLTKSLFVLMVVAFVGMGVVYFLGAKILEKLKPTLSDSLFETLSLLITTFCRFAKGLLVALPLSAVSQLLFIVLFFMTSRFLDYNMPFWAFLVFVPLGMICSSAPISPAGVGVGQAAFFYLFSLYDSNSGQLGVLGFTFFQALMLLWGLVGAYLSMTLKKPGVADG